jgi:hypothetical protein
MHYEKISVLQLGLQLGFSCDVHLQLNVFYNLSVLQRHNSLYMKLYRYAIHATT